MFWNWIDVVQCVSYQVWFDKGFDSLIHNTCIIKCVSQSVKVTLLQSRIETFQLLSQLNVWVQVISTMDQRWINGGSMVDQWCINNIIHCVTYKKNYHLNYKTDCENGNETAWTCQIWHSEIVKGTVLQSNIVAFSLFSQLNMWIQVISTID